MRQLEKFLNDWISNDIKKSWGFFRHYDDVIVLRFLKRIYIFGILKYLWMKYPEVSDLLQNGGISGWRWWWWVIS